MSDIGPRPEILPDLLAPGLRLVVCGSAVGDRSAKAGAYYAGPGNRFWTMLNHVGLTPRILLPSEFPTLLAHGIGLTDIVKTRSGADSILRAQDFDRAGLLRLIQLHQPVILVFNGKRAAAAFFRERPEYGYQRGRDVGTTRIHVAPSTSGAARAFWDESIWRGVAQEVLRQVRDQGSTSDMIAPSSDSGR
jgi:TDG/mug DNA glycosylase family protein